MEISRRHLQELEQQELYDKLEEALGSHHVLAVADGDSGLVELAEKHKPPRAAELQAQVDGMTRNQRRVLNKRMAKAARKGK